LSIRERKLERNKVGFPQFVDPVTPCNLPLDRCPVARERASKRILLLRLGAAGDILIASPLLKSLRKAYPDAYITWIIEHSQREIVDANPYVDELIIWNGRYWKKLLRYGVIPFWINQWLRLRSALHSRKFDLFVSFEAHQWPLLVWFCGAKRKIGVFDFFPNLHPRGKTSPVRNLFDRCYYLEDLPAHRTDQYLVVLNDLEIDQPDDKRMVLGYTEDDVKQASAFLLENGITDGKFVVMAPKTTWTTKTWLPERYAKVADLIASEFGLPVLLIGTSHEAAYVESVANLMKSPPILAANLLKIRELAALLSMTTLLICGDTGPMHMASALGTPQINLFGSTPVDMFAPIEGAGTVINHKVPCGPCNRTKCSNNGDDYLKCLKLITVEEVMCAVRAQLVRLDSSTDALSESNIA
jgi:ADP-heptose:LPS heptosyltransferase